MVRFASLSFARLIAFGVLALAACGGATDLTCTDDVPAGASLFCSCAKSGSCSFDVCGAGKAGCSLECDDGASCTGDCGAQCGYHCRAGATCHTAAGALSEITCSTGASCDLSVGDNAKVVCQDTKSCAVRCVGACEVACSLANCNVTCAAGGAPIGTGTEIVCGNPG